MTYLYRMFRSFVVLQLLPALESASEEALIGGQAVLEGVMMRSPHAWGIAVRRSTGEMATHCEVLERPSEKRKWLAWPLVRGLVTLGQAMKLGYRALQFSSNIMMASLAAEEEKESQEKEAQGKGKSPAAPAARIEDAKPEMPPQISGWMMFMNVVLSVGFFIVMYKLVPLTLARGLQGSWSAMNNNVVFNLVDGVIRLVLFLLFIWGISLFADIRRVFEYHGAEHKTVFAYEAKREIPAVKFTQGFSTYHPRCGTSFLMTIMLISIFVYAAVPIASANASGHFFDRAFWERFGIRILLLPVIASVSYEMIRFSAKHGRSLFALLTRPGLWLQRITTKQCSDDQVECAIKALDEAMNLEKAHGGELVIA
ncbi:MAG TPA: DUF1385 domain-containing protein [Candidatus Saccharimonadales bacterium]|jgi:uncharacterized protein YqhQ|nr:DUF1385 domain-containing protein [Candidatus Saccharimonadales bacterium]